LIPVFKQFDKDDNNTIDKNELKDLANALGHSLSDEQLELAFKDLDLNKDGVIDFSEFKRWYFTGLRPFNDRTRNMLKLSKTGLSLAQALSDYSLYHFII
jgi:hypothetical protein